MDGWRHGDWVERWPNGTVSTGLYVEGERNGCWVERYPEEDVVQEGPNVAGHRHGTWTVRELDDVWQEVYVDGCLTYFDGKSVDHDFC